MGSPKEEVYSNNIMGVFLPFAFGVVDLQFLNRHQLVQICYCLMFQEVIKKLEEPKMVSCLSAREAARMPVAEVAETLRTDIDFGLNTEEVEKRCRFHGFNEFDVGEKEAIWAK